MKAYIYPNSKKGDIPNPYLDNLINSVNKKIQFDNYYTASKTGLFDLLNYIFRIDILLINWLEDVMDKRGGRLQWIFFRAILVPILRIRKVKIIWILHNNLSHSTNKIKIKRRIFNYCFKLSTLIITHAKDGVRIIKENRKDKTNNTLYIPHPVNSSTRNNSDKKDIDILIWGSISPYKGIHEFITQVKTNSYLKSLRITIAGKIRDKNYKTLLTENLSDNISLLDKQLSLDELHQYLANSKIILFIYSTNSILSSGALMDSLGYGNTIVGPLKGAFKDLHELGMIHGFNDTKEIASICKNILEQKILVDDETKIKVKKFIEDNSWENFGKKLINNLNKID